MVIMLHEKAWQWYKQLYRIRGTYLENEATFFKQKMENWRVASTLTVNPEERQFMIDSGVSVNMMSKMELSPEEQETVKVSRLPTTVIITANGSIDTTRGIWTCSSRSDSSKTLRWCYHWETVRTKSCQKGQNVPFKCGSFVPIVVPGLPSEAHTTNLA